MGQAGLVFACCGPWLARRASKVKSEAFDGGSLHVSKWLRGRCLWEVALDERATLWVAIGSGFVFGLDAEEAERERGGFHPGEIRGES